MTDDDEEKKVERGEDLAEYVARRVAEAEARGEPPPHPMALIEEFALLELERSTGTE